MIVPKPSTEPNGPVRTVLWQRIDSPGSEWCTLEREPEGWRLRGIVLAEVATVPVLVRAQHGEFRRLQERARRTPGRWNRRLRPGTT